MEKESEMTDVERGFGKRRSGFYTGLNSLIEDSVSSEPLGTIRPALDNLISEMELLGYRERTLYDYNYHMERYMKLTGVVDLESMNKPSLLKYISHNDVSSATKRIRTKVMKAILNKWYNEGLLEFNFWKDIRIKVDEEVKRGVSTKEMSELLKSLDLNDFVQLRDACIFLLIWETGVRLGTIARMENDVIDFNERLVHFDGSTMKNHKPLSLPISKRLGKMLKALIETNKEVLNYNSKTISNLFISIEGNPMNAKSFSKRVMKYKNDTGLEYINPHAIRRGFGKRLLDRGVNIAVISKALNHSSIDTTTKYLHVDNEEVIDTLKSLL